MSIKVIQEEKDISDLFTRAKMPPQSVAYQFHVKAEALRLANFFKEAISKYLNSIMIDRENADTYYGLGLCYKKTGKLDKAIDAFEKAKSLRELDYKIYYELGVSYLLKGEVCLAMKHLVKTLKLNPNNINAQIQLALAHEIVEEPEIALMFYQKIIDTTPGYLKAYDHQSSLLMTLERYQEASAVLNKILKLNPDYYRAYLGIAICFDKLNKNSEALRYYRRFIDYKPNSQHSDFVETRLNELQSSKNNSKVNIDNSIMRLVK